MSAATTGSSRARGPLAPGDVVAVADRRLRAVARVLGADGGSVTLRLETPAEARTLGDRVTLDVGSVRGLLRASGAVQDRAGLDVRIALDAPPALVQRREHVRASARLPVSVERPGRGGARWDGETVDLGGGGARLAVPRLRVDPGEHLRLTLELPGEERVVIVAQAVRAHGRDVSVTFDRISPAQREALIRFVFACLRRGVKVR